MDLTHQDRKPSNSENGMGIAADDDPLAPTLDWISRNEPLVRMLAVTRRRCPDVAVYAPEALRMVCCPAPASWLAMGLSGSRDDQEFAASLERILVAWGDLDAWHREAVAGSVRAAAEHVGAPRIQRWLTVSLFGRFEECVFEDALVALGKDEAMRRVHSTLKAFRLANLVN